jgi:type VI protein secretion system component VasF
MEAKEGEREAQERLAGLNALIAYYDRLMSVLEALKNLAENEKSLELQQRIIEEIARAKASREELSQLVPPPS